MITDPELSGKKVALLGFGMENQAVFQYLQGQAAEITICDQREELEPVLPGVNYRLGPDYLASLTDFDLIFRTPAIPYLTKVIQAARQAGVAVTSQTKYFLEHCPSSTIGVTGTKGKGTTASLISSALMEAKKAGELPGSVYLAGNIGQPMISLLPALNQEDWVILELSSFQLQDLTTSPDIAVVLNVTIDHLDHHRDEAEYISAKKNIVRYQTAGDSLVVNLDSLTSLLFADETPAQTYFFSREKSVDQGCFIERLLGEDQIILRLPGRADQLICMVRELQLVGAYNLENVTAALTAAALAGASQSTLKKAVVGFTGLPHRLQFVAEKQGVRYFDDSKATTPDSTMAALLSFDQPITLIVGGSSKGADYTELVATITASTATAVICIGQEGKRLAGLLLDSGAGQDIIDGAQTMPEIVAQAAELSQPGSVVLLSPAAASFDMFANAEDRGNQFQEAVIKLPN